MGTFIALVLARDPRLSRAHEANPVGATARDRDADLYVPHLNFVFGEGDSHRGVAVFSLARLHGSDELLRKRATTEAIHELGHTYGLPHCDEPHCVMWFSNTLSETDRKGTRLCSRHARELAHARSARRKP